MKDYKVFTKQAEKDRILVEFMEAQERDHWLHTINRQRYQSILATAPAGKNAFRTRIEGLLAETEDRITEVEAIIAATISQMPSAETIATIAIDLEAERTQQRAQVR